MEARTRQDKVNPWANLVNDVFCQIIAKMDLKDIKAMLETSQEVKKQFNNEAVKAILKEKVKSFFTRSKLEQQLAVNQSWGIFFRHIAFVVSLNKQLGGAISAAAINAFRDKAKFSFTQWKQKQWKEIIEKCNRYFPKKYRGKLEEELKNHKTRLTNELMQKTPLRMFFDNLGFESNKEEKIKQIDRLLNLLDHNFDKVQDTLDSEILSDGRTGEILQKYASLANQDLVYSWQAGEVYGLKPIEWPVERVILNINYPLEKLIKDQVLEVQEPSSLRK